MTDLTPDALDSWRWGQANRGLDLNTHIGVIGALEAYRKLVRENVLPPAEPIGNDLPKWAQDEAERLARAEPAPKWGVHDSPRSHYALARLIAKQGKPEVAEPTQDTLDAREIMGGAYYTGESDNDPYFKRAKQALAEIKARVRREAIKEHIAAEQKRRLRMQQAPAMGRDVGWI